MTVVEDVGPDGHAVSGQAAQPYPYGVWADPLELEPRGGTGYTVLKRLVFVVAALNIFVLAGLFVFKVSAGGDTTAPVLGGERVVADEPAPTTTASFDIGDDADTPEGADDPAVGAYPPAYPDPFEPTVNEVQPEAKHLGSLVAYVITNYEVDASLNNSLATMPPVDPEMYDAMVLEVQSVHHPGMWSRGTVEYAQLGGHLDGRISIIVVIRQELGLEGSGLPERVETRVMEIRLARSLNGDWELETIASAGGRPVERPTDLDPTAAAVVDHPLIDLPDTAAWDIYRGGIDRQLLQLMLDIADRTPYKVVVLQTGHSYNVFGTNRVSNHSVGRAVDIYMLESELVVDAHDPSSSFYALSEWIVSRYDIHEFGSPWRFPDAVAHTFTNEVHHDHLHIGVKRYPASPDPPPTTRAPITIDPPSGGE